MTGSGGVQYITGFNLHAASGHFRTHMPTCAVRPVIGNGQWIVQDGHSNLIVPAILACYFQVIILNPVVEIFQCQQEEESGWNIPHPVCWLGLPSAVAYASAGQWGWLVRICRQHRGQMSGLRQGHLYRGYHQNRHSTTASTTANIVSHNIVSHNSQYYGHIVSQYRHTNSSCIHFYIIFLLHWIWMSGPAWLMQPNWGPRVYKRCSWLPEALLPTHWKRMPQTFILTRLEQFM